MHGPENIRLTFLHFSSFGEMRPHGCIAGHPKWKQPHPVVSWKPPKACMHTPATTPPHVYGRVPLMHAPLCPVVLL